MQFIANQKSSHIPCRGSASVSERVSICAKHKQRVVSGSIAWEHKNDVVFDAFFMMMVN